MQDAIAQVLSYVWGVWRFRWVALIMAWVFAVTGWLFVYQMPEKYVATARIFVDSNSVLRPLLRGLAIQPNVNQRIAMMSRTLLSRPNLEKLMRMTDLDLEVQTDREKESFLTELRSAVTLSGDRGNASLYSLQVTDEDRDVAKRVVQALITVFIESSLSDKREDSSGAQDFLDEQISDYELRLIESEDKLAAFKQKHTGDLPNEGGGYYARLGEARSGLAETQLSMRELENRRDELQRQIEGEEPVFLSSGVTVSNGSPLDARIQSLYAQMDVLLARYTLRHPSLAQLQFLIDDLEAERDAQLEAAMSQGGSAAFPSLSGSPVYQGMRSMLAETNARIAELKVRVEDYKGRVVALEERVNNIPIIEAELMQLNRDYQVVSRQHQQLLSRRESARLSQDVEQNANDVTFRVVDPPFVPFRPSEPNKLLLNSLVLVVALGAGVAFALVVSLIKPVVGDQRSLTRLTGLPLLGSVTLIPTREERRQDFRALVAFAALAAVLFVVFAGVNYPHMEILA